MPNPQASSEAGRAEAGPVPMGPAERPPVRAWLVVLAVWVSFMCFTVCRWDLPAVNEPHYLCKAQHFWDPSYCPGDFFLDSADAHVVFYATVGVLTRWFTLEATAWIGRAVGLGLLAWGWVLLARAVVPGRWAALWAAWAFLAMQAVGNLSGEWIVGGIEAKVFSYAFLFAAVGLWLGGRAVPAGLCGGLAVAFHPLVGVWGLACGAFATAVLAIRRRGTVPTTRPSWGRLAVAALVLVAAALPGLVPALQVVGDATSVEARSATYIQVFHRLRHHLDPTTFPLEAYAAYGLLLVAWLVARYRSDFGTAERWLAAFTLGSVGVAVVGIVAGFAFGLDRANQMPAVEMTWLQQLCLTVLKFYPFRLADVMLPLAAALILAARAPQWLASAEPGHPARVRPWVLFAGLVVFSLAWPSTDRNPSRMDPQRLADWLTVCAWVERNTPPDAHFRTPRSTWAFKWYAQRAEYFAYKDCPQDAEGILEWWDRNSVQLQRLPRPLQDAGVTHLILYRSPPLRQSPRFEQGDYKVYRMDDLWPTE